MTKQINQRWQSFLLATIATFIVLGAFSSVFTQKADKYPKPDFSAMEEYFEIVEWEYDFTSGSRFIVTAKPKQKTVPLWWEITWRDAKGVMINQANIHFSMSDIQATKVGEPVRGSSLAPFKRRMSEVKSVTITENPEGGDARTAN